MTDYTPKKKKNDSQYQRFSLPIFLTLSVILHMTTFVVTGYLSGALFAFFPPNTASAALASAVPQLIVIGMQAWFLNYQFKWSAQRWFIASLIAWIGVVAVALLLAMSAPTMNITTISIIGIIISLGGTLFISGMQTLVLRDYVSRAWLWIIATFGSLFVGGIANTAIVNIVNANAGNWSLPMVQALHRGAGGLVTGIVFALTLTLLVRLTARGKRKRITDTDVDSDDAQVESASRLSDDAPTDERAFYADERLAQQNQL
ncbi:MAG: hypothetical protein AAFR81_21350 [Chloroflexota bacterium]